MTGIPETFADLLAGFTPGQVARMESFADQAPERSAAQQRLLERAFGGAGQRWLASREEPGTAA